MTIYRKAPSSIKVLAPMAHVVGVDRGQAARAYPLDLLREKRALHDQLHGEDLVILWLASSALDARIIAEGDDAGATGVFLREIDGRTRLPSPPLAIRNSSIRKPGRGGTSLDTPRPVHSSGVVSNLWPITESFRVPWSAFVAER